MLRVVVTGATGFIGRHLCAALARRADIQLSLLVRKTLLEGDTLHAIGRVAVTGEFGADIVCLGLMKDVDAVVHLAGCAHVMNDGQLAEAMYQKANVLGTRCLAEAAVAAGVKRFIFVSSVKAVGERGFFDDKTTPAPHDAYGRSKLAAEQVLFEVARGTGMTVTVLRLPLIYGPGVSANFLRLMRFVDHWIPLPLASVGNKRSLLYVGNLVSAIQCSLEVDRPVPGTFFISDGPPVSTPDLIRAIATTMNKRPNLWPCPLPLLHMAASMIGKQAEISRLTESLVIDSQPFSDALDWTPPFTLGTGLRETIDWYSRQP